MTDPQQIAREAAAHHRPNRRKPRMLAALALASMLLAFGVGGYALASSQQTETDALAVARRVAGKAQALERQVRSLGGDPIVDVPAPDELPEQVRGPAGIVAEIQDAEIQQFERQQPERQDRERQQAERQDREFQNLERQQAEIQDEEIQDPEEQEPELQEPEEQEPEQQDAEVDDPDPNSALDFQVDDQCNPPAGEFVTDVGASWQRSPGTITLVLTCTSAAAPAQP